MHLWIFLLALKFKHIPPLLHVCSDCSCQQACCAPPGMMSDKPLPQQCSCLPLPHCGTKRPPALLTATCLLCSNSVMELARGVRSQLQALVGGLEGQDLRPMSLGLSHSLSRYKLKFSPDKVRPCPLQAGAMHGLVDCRHVAATSREVCAVLPRNRNILQD